MNSRKPSRSLREILGKRGPHYLSLLREPTTGKVLDNDHSYPVEEDGILRLISAKQRAIFDAQATTRANQRQNDGWQAPTPEEFRRLPQTSLTGWPMNYWQRRSVCTAEMWRILEHIRVEEDRLPIGPMGNALDLTAGMGWLGYGLDVSGYITIVLGEDTGRYGLGAYQYSRYLRLQASISNPPLTANSFDLVVFSFSLEILDSPQIAIENAARLLNEGGILIIMSDQFEKSALDAADAMLRGIADLKVRRQRVGAMGTKANRVMKNMLGGSPDVPPLIIARRQ